MTVEANKTYFFSAISVPGVAMDNMYAEYVPAEQCAPDWTPPVTALDASDISLTKSCTPAISTEQNGDVGQLWTCSVDVSVPEAPFAGTLSITDAYTDTTTATGEVVASSSASGNFVCASGATCTIAGTDFDASGTETLSYSVFVTASELQDSYPMQNCVEGSYDDDGSGTAAPVAGNCVSAQWIPRNSITKTCDPIVAVSSGPMTMNCQLDVTGTNLATDSIIFAGDFFGAMPPATVTVAGTMMNVTSSEPWSCFESASGSAGWCELSAADMLAAGGASTINVSFAFTTDQASGEVVNCPMTDILAGSFGAATGQRSSEPAMRSPQRNAAGRFPDICVVLDLPTETLPPKIEDVIAKKSCERPQQATVNGVLGYTWDCRAEITVTPTPFAGTFTLEDDASTISIGTAQFLSTSEPANCTGLQSDHLTCVFDGATMGAPQVVTYQLFTALSDPNQPIEWKNCIKGHADTAAGTFASVPMCTGRTIKPEIKLEDPKKISLKKRCDAPVAAVENGVSGKRWSCEVAVQAVPAPFAGSFSFVEDATAVSGTTDANIIGYSAGNPNWACSGNFPQQQTECGVSGVAFSASGLETINFELFAADEGNAVDWRNCVSGAYKPDGGKPRDIKGNCVETHWDGKPTDPPVFTLKKGCRLGGVQDGNAYYACTIYIQQSSGAPITDPLVFDELFSTTSGNSAAPYILNLQGTPAMPNGWDCQQPPLTNSASCTISAADFNASTNHRINAYMSIPLADLGKEDFQNCAQVRIGDQVVGSADCVDLDEPAAVTEFDVKKSCKAAGERQTFGSSVWFQPYQCTLNVSTNGVPFTGPLWLSEDLHFGQNPGATSIQNITSSDPWDCTSPPYTAPAQGNEPVCSIQGSQFPNSGSSTLTVDLMMGPNMDLFGAENCVSLSFGGELGQAPVVASDCFEIAAPADPLIDLTKTCEPAVRGANNQWSAQCEVTISGTNLPAGQSIRITDELTGTGQTTIASGAFDPNPFTGSNCGIFTVAGGTGSACDVSTDQITGNGGSITLPYTATLVGSGRLRNDPAQNCAFADSPALGLHAPATGTGKACVTIALNVMATPGSTGSVSGVPDLPGEPVGPSGPITGTATLGAGASVVVPVDPVTPSTPLAGDSPSCSLDTLFVVDASKWMDASHGNRLDITKTAIIQALDGLRGNGSTAAIRARWGGGGMISGARDIDTHYQSIVSGTLPQIHAGGPSSWDMSFTNTPFSSPAPLVIFITAGNPTYSLVPNTSTYQQVPVADAVSAAVPRIAARRAQGSRVIGIGIGTDVNPAHLMAAVGNNITTYSAGGSVNPLVNDVIMIPNAQDAPTVFAQIAATYCPKEERPLSASNASQDIAAPIVPQPIASFAITKEQTSTCVANRNSQTYDCGFRLSVTNTGTAPYLGPLVMSDTAGAPGIASAQAVSGSGWSCGAAVGNAVSCTNAALSLAPGASSYVDLRMKLHGLRKGGTMQNCATVGVTPDRTQRVALIQKVMNDRGLKAGPVDGQPGKQTYAALAQLRRDLGLPDSRDFDDALFAALGLPLQKTGEASCVNAPLPAMPAPPLQCNARSTVKQGESCACRYDNMVRRNATSCRCAKGFTLVNGKGCVKKAAPKPAPAPEPALKCDPRSTYQRGDICACIDHKNAKNISKTQCACTNGLPMVNGKCLPIKITPSRPDVDAVGTEKCRIMLNGICIK
ncbi:peptidoglycan-binding domain-containing protein [Thioclava indica]|uniref:peptidoglycan-binding domain-containing protein n=1 Tax=Thioclava indica TaxID=1353528 RepID=UPI0012DBD996|nr:peptidoglycan-binding domain-containing protein [Thioclava indica]